MEPRQPPPPPAEHSPLFAAVVNGQLVADALLVLEGVPVQTRLLQSAHFLLLPSDAVQDAAHPCWPLYTEQGDREQHHLQDK